MSDKLSAFVLDEWVLEKDFARDNGTSRRSVARMRQEPNGLPWMLWNGQVHIHVPGARAYSRTNHERKSP
jgi:hypothetical protein